MSRKVVELVLASGILRQTSVEVLDVNDRSVTSSSSKLVQGTSAGLIHDSWIPDSATRLLVRDTESSVVVSGIREIVVASGDVIPLSQTAVRIRTAADASSSSSGGNLTDGNKGDITVAGSGTVWTINTQAVTLSKMQYMPQQTVIGRETNTGTPQHIALASGLAIQNGYLGFSFVTAATPIPNLPSSNLLGYWTARIHVTTDASNRVSQWADVSNTVSFTQSASAARPIFTHFGKFPAVSFPTSAYRSLSSSIVPATGTNARSFATVFFPAVRSNASQAVLFSYGTNTTYQAFGLQTHANNAVLLAVDYYGVQRAFSFMFSHPVCVVLSFSAGVTSVYVNGMLSQTIDDSFLGLNTSSTVPLQLGRDVADARYYSGFLFEFAVWNRALTQQEAENVSVQLMQRYQSLFLYAL